MKLQTLSENKPEVLGLLQSIFGMTYIAIVVTLLQNAWRFHVEPPEYIMAMTMLTLLVISATIMGIVFLGMPLYFVLKGNWSKALKVVGFTLLYSFAILVVVLTVTFIVRG